MIESVTDEHRKISQTIIDCINNGEAPITYQDLSKRLKERFDLSISPRKLSGPLGTIQVCCNEAHVPCLPVLVISKKLGIPGKGFYNIFGMEYNENDLPFFRRFIAYETVRCLGQEDWSSLYEVMAID